MNWVSVSSTTFVAQLPTGILVRYTAYGDQTAMVFVPNVKLGTEEDGTFGYDVINPPRCTCKPIEKHFMARDPNCRIHAPIGS